jgi:hypothetical protein
LTVGRSGSWRCEKKEALLSPPTAPAANRTQPFYFGPEATIQHREPQVTTCIRLQKKLLISELLHLLNESAVLPSSRASLSPSFGIRTSTLVDGLQPAFLFPTAIVTFARPLVRRPQLGRTCAQLCCGRRGPTHLTPHASNLSKTKSDYRSAFRL